MEISQTKLISKEKLLLKYCKEVMDAVCELYLLKKDQKETIAYLKKEPGHKK